MIFFTRLGFLVPLLYILVLAIFQVITDSVTGSPEYFIENSFISGIASFTSAILLWSIGKKLNNNQSRTLHDQKTGEAIVVTTYHTFFWIRFEYWAFVAVLLGIFISVI